MPSFASWAFVTGIVTVNHASNDLLTPVYKLKCHHRRLWALESSSHPSDLVAAPASTWSLPSERSSSMSSSFIADKVFARELTDADVFASLPLREQLALCPTELVGQILHEESDLARVLSSIQRIMR